MNEFCYYFNEFTEQLVHLKIEFSENMSIYIFAVYAKCIKSGSKRFGASFGVVVWTKCPVDGG